MGKPKYIETPEQLWQLFLDYKKEVKTNPIIVKDWVGKDSDEVYREKEKPLTMVGFECYVAEHTKITCPDLTEYFEGKNESYKNYFPISSRIKKEIQNDQITGGMVMIYSQSITARLNDLAENTNINAQLTTPIFGDNPLDEKNNE